METCESLEKIMRKELETLEQKIKGGADMTANDLDKIDKIVHTLKGLATYMAMKEAEEYNMSGNNMSGYRGRAMNGRFVSREPALENGSSYAEGYSRGYNEGRSQAEAQNMSSHYYPMHEYYRY